MLVGGFTRTPAVVDLVKSLTGRKEPNRSVNRDKVASASYLATFQPAEEFGALVAAEAIRWLTCAKATRSPRSSRGSG
jgi:hypothetical protein